MESTSPLLAMRGIGKNFPGVVALSGVDVTVRAGEIHALLGENGAGKSTLIKVLTGVYAPDSGSIQLGGQPIHPASPKDAERLGISTVYQEVNLIPSLSVAENICLGRQPGRFGFLNWRALRRHARAALERLELDCDVDVELGALPIAIQQMVAIARALDLRAKLLVLDEPTSSLDEKEVAELFKVMLRLRAEGMGIVFVTHFLDQVYEVCVGLTVLRNGVLVGERLVAGFQRLDLVRMMLGQEAAETTPQVATPAPSADKQSGDALLSAKGLGRRGALHPLDIELRRGEVTGLAGLLGSGRTETARLLFGADRADSGTITMGGKPLRLRSPRDAVRAGMAFCPEDRKAEGLMLNLSVRENLLIALQAKRGSWRTLSRVEGEQLCEHYIRSLRIKTPGPDTPVKNLSGGNQQKVLLARWLATQPALIILDEPTRGIDIGAKAEIERLVAKLRADGLAVLFISSEIEEVARASTRVVVMRERRKADELNGAGLDEHTLMHAIAGVSAKK